MKVVLIVGLVSAVARVFEWSRRRTLLVALPAVAAYVLVSGAGPAGIRSAFMAGATMLAATGARRTDPIPMLALAAAIMLGLNPQLVEDPGFQLSFLGTAGILLLAAPIAARLPGPRLIAEPFAVTIAAQVATVPIMAGTFGVISLGGSNARSPRCCLILSASADRLGSVRGRKSTLVSHDLGEARDPALRP